MKRLLTLIPVIALLAWSAACSSQKAPAQAALNAAETAWAPVSADAVRYVPDQAKEIDAALAAAKDAMAKGDYAAVIQGATALPARIVEVQKAIADKKIEWTTAWKTLDSTLGTAIVAVQAKVDELMTAKKLPAGVDKATVEAGKAGVATAQQAYTDAKQAFQGGDYAEALAKANQTKAGLTKVIADLKLDMPLLREQGWDIAESAKASIKAGMKKPG